MSSAPDPLREAAVDALLARHPDLPGSIRLVAASPEVDVRQSAVVRVHAEVDGVPVFGRGAVVRFDDAESFTGLTDDLALDIEVDAAPTWSAAEAVAQAWPSPPAAVDADLQVVRWGGTDHLAWRVRGRVGGPEPRRPVVFVDAHSGRPIWAYDDLRTAAAEGTGTASVAGSVTLQTWKKGSRYYLEDSTRNLGTYSYEGSTTVIAYVTDGDNRWTSDPVAVQAAWSAAVADDYWRARFGREGIDGADGPGDVASLTGSGTTSGTFVHYGSGYANAFWDSTGIVLGDGDGTSFDPLVSPDIVGHELAHGLTEYTADLTYAGEPGALNESMSDVFGAMIEAYAAGVVSADTWTIGEAVYTPSRSGDALRWLDDPAADGVSFDHYGSDVASADVHHGSGIGNLAFFLLAEGGPHPVRGGDAVPGIGSDAAEQIWYRALTAYMTPSTDYAGARTATLAAAAELYGEASEAYGSVGDAWDAVGVGATDVCAGYDAAHDGTLSTTDTSVYEPDGGTFTLSGAGAQAAHLIGPDTADFDLYLQKSSGGSWSTVKSATGAGSDASFTYSGRSGGTFRYRVKRVSGSGAYVLCTSAP